MPAPAFRSASSADTASPTVCAVPAGVQAGDLLVAFAGAQAGTDVPEIDIPDGWTQYENWGEQWTDQPSWISLHAFLRVATANEPASYVFTSELAPHIRVAILAYKWVGEVYSVWTVGTATQDDSPTTPAVQPDADGIVVAGVIDGGDGIITAEASWTQRASLSSFAVGDRRGLAWEDIPQTVWPDDFGMPPSIGIAMQIPAGIIPPPIPGAAWTATGITNGAYPAVGVA